MPDPVASSVRTFVVIVMLGFSAILAPQGVRRRAILFGVITRRRTAGHLKIGTGAKIDTVERYKIMIFASGVGGSNGAIYAGNGGGGLHWGPASSGPIGERGPD